MQDKRERLTILREKYSELVAEGRIKSAEAVRVFSELKILDMQLNNSGTK